MFKEDDWYILNSKSDVQDMFSAMGVFKHEMWWGMSPTVKKEEEKKIGVAGDCWHGNTRGNVWFFPTSEAG